MEIKVLGTGCAKCKTLYATVENAVKELGTDAKVVKIEDMGEILKFNVLSLPAIVIDGTVAVQGKSLNLEEVKKLIKK